jgi:serine/threonine-protein kinase RsbW
MPDLPPGSNTPSPVIEPFKVCVRSGRLAVREALSAFLDALSPLDLDSDDTGTVELVLAEVLNNIVEHAYPPPDPSGPIRICCAPQPDGLVVRITDKGRAMPDGELPLGADAPLDMAIDDLPEGGFGWFLIRSLAQDISYTRVGDENHLVMRLAIDVPNLPDAPTRTQGIA